MPEQEYTANCLECGEEIVNLVDILSNDSFLEGMGFGCDCGEATYIESKYYPLLKSD